MSFLKYRIVERFMRFKKRFLITDEEDRLIGYVSKHPFSLRKKATLFDESDIPRLIIYKKPFSFRSTYFIEKEEQRIFRVFKTIGFRASIFVESLIAPDAFMIQGNIWYSEYAFYKNDQEFAHVSRDIWKIPDNYGVAIKEDEEDHLLILALVIVIDLIHDSRKKKS